MRRFSTRLGALLMTCVGVGWTAPASAFSWPQEAARVEAQLKSEVTETRRAAARRLGKLSPVLARPLVQAGLDDPDVEVRLAAAQAAVQFRYRDLGPQVVGWLLESDVRLRVAAVDVLFQGPTEAAIEPLGRVLADADPRVRRGAAAVLGEMGRLSRSSSDDMSGRAAAQLLGRLDDPEASVRIAVVDSLASLGEPRAVLPLVSKIQDGDATVRVAVVRALGVLGDRRAGSALLLAARDRDTQVVTQAVRALGWLGDPASIPSLVASSQEATPVTVRRAVLEALGRLARQSGVHRAAAIERLVSALGDAELVAAATRALTMVGQPAAPALRQCLVEGAGEVSAVCVRVLAQVDSAGAVEVIRRALDQGSLAAPEALTALGSAGSSEGLVLALEHLTHPDTEIRNLALESVGRVLRESRGDHRAAGPLLRALQSGTWTTAQRSRLMEALGWTGDVAAAPALGSAAEGGSRRERLFALIGLGRIPGHGRDAVLLAALDDPLAEMRRAAALSLRSTGSAESTNELLTRLESREGQDREAVALALASPLGSSKNEKFVERAAALLDQVSGPVRDSLIEALARTVSFPAGARVVARLVAAGTPADRAKWADVLGFYPEARELIRQLVADDQAAVRAHAVWSLGRLSPDESDRRRVIELLKDPDAAVAGNALGTLSRWMSGESSKEELTAVLCRTLDDSRPMLRANAVTGLFRLGAECTAGTWRQVLRNDPADQVRAAVVRGLSASLAAQREDSSSSFELRRCSVFERSQRVSALCDAALDGETSAVADVVAGQPRLIFVAGRTSGQPQPRVPFVATRKGADGVLRSGWTDRRGAFLTQSEQVELLETSVLRADLR